LASMATLVVGAAGEGPGAAPFLLAPGVLWRQEKAFLLHAGALRTRNAVADLGEVTLPPAMMTILSWMAAPRTLSSSEWEQRFEQNPTVRDWLKTVRQGHGWYSGMWFAIWSSLGSEIEVALKLPATW
jgi:hypothetical protein